MGRFSKRKIAYIRLKRSASNGCFISSSSTAPVKNLQPQYLEFCISQKDSDVRTGAEDSQSCCENNSHHKYGCQNLPSQKQKSKVKLLNNAKSALPDKAPAVMDSELSDLAKQKIHDFIHTSSDLYVIIDDPYLKRVSQALIELHGSNESIKRLCDDADAEFSGRKLVRPHGKIRRGKPTKYADIAGDAIGKQLQHLAMDLKHPTRRLHYVSSVTHILTSSPDDQDAHCDNNVCDRRHISALFIMKAGDSYSIMMDMSPHGTLPKHEYSDIHVPEGALLLFRNAFHYGMNHAGYRWLMFWYLDLKNSQHFRKENFTCRWGDVNHINHVLNDNQNEIPKEDKEKFKLLLKQQKC